MVLKIASKIATVLTEISMTEQCVAGQVPVITRFSQERSESLVTIGHGKLQKSCQVVVSVGEIGNGNVGNLEMGFSDKSVSQNSPENTSGFSTYIGQVP